MISFQAQRIGKEYGVAAGETRESYAFSAGNLIGIPTRLTHLWGYTSLALKTGTHPFFLVSPGQLENPSKSMTDLSVASTATMSEYWWKADLSMPLQDPVMVELTGHCTFVSISYESVPESCPQCNIIGHSSATCWKQKPDGDSSKGRGRSRDRTAQTKQSGKGKGKAVDDGSSSSAMTKEKPSDSRSPPRAQDVSQTALVPVFRMNGVRVRLRIL